MRLLPSTSGNQLATRWLATDSLNPKGIVLHFHGNSGHMEATQEKVSWLTDYGYHVLIFDYSGFGHSTGQARDEALYQDACSMLLSVPMSKNNQDCLCLWWAHPPAAMFFCARG
ncbi:hydrolases of the alpha/beta superfamily [Photobacterium aphoticum]|uniref:Hydrolases of the alpha/beta superfamily n=1 Tax=Photobacterium aphoticum TaxID=754436 RepID=A0A090QKU5_9GAMM|nr:hydrolases of the alpha/beta superfamily [Photobacterium aphoticum]